VGQVQCCIDKFPGVCRVFSCPWLEGIPLEILDSLEKSNNDLPGLRGALHDLLAYQKAVRKASQYLVSEAIFSSLYAMYSEDREDEAEVFLRLVTTANQECANCKTSGHRYPLLALACLCRHDHRVNLNFLGAL
jgi:hypothetical protein